jgi:hypothetical protein
MEPIEYTTMQLKNYSFKYASLQNNKLNDYIIPNTNERIIVIKDIMDMPKIRFVTWDTLKDEKNLEHFSTLEFLVFDENTENKVIFESFQYWCIQILFDLIEDDDRLSDDEEEEFKEAKKIIDPNKEFKNEYLIMCQKLSIPFQVFGLVLDQYIYFDMDKKIIKN